MEKDPMHSLPFQTHSYHVNESHVAELEHKWITLQDQANASAFVAWFWVKQWLAQKDLSTDNCLCVEVKQGQDTLGLALFGIKTKRVFWGLSFRQYFLHRRPNLDRAQYIFTS